MKVFRYLSWIRVPVRYHVLKGKKHYDVYQGQSLDDVMKLEIAWFYKYLKGDK